MRLTVVCPAIAEWNEGAGIAAIGSLARAVEMAGFDALAFTEHPAPSAKWLENGGHPTFDPFVALAYCAAVTEQIRLMPYLAVLPYRNPVLTAKAVATLDVVSNGRLTLVVGAGYLRSEFLALGVDFDDRNDLLDEALGVLRSVWIGAALSHRGQHFTAKAQVVEPGPVQRPHPPIWVGGNSVRARERAAALGDGWSPLQADAALSRSARTAALETIEDIEAAIASINEMRSGRTGDFPVQLEAAATNFANDDRSMAERLDEIAELAAIGVASCVVQLPRRSSLAATIHDATRLGRELKQPAPGKRTL